MNIDNLSMSHIVQYNPIIYANEVTKKKYLSCLTKYINIAGASKRKYIKAQIVAYRTIVNSYEPVENMREDLNNFDVGCISSVTSVADYKGVLIFG